MHYSAKVRTFELIDTPLPGIELNYNLSLSLSWYLLVNAVSLKFEAVHHVQALNLYENMCVDRYFQYLRLEAIFLCRYLYSLF